MSDHDFDPHTERCIDCGIARCDVSSPASCPNSIREREWLLVSIKGVAWVRAKNYTPRSVA